MGFRFLKSGSEVRHVGIASIDKNPYYSGSVCFMPLQTFFSKILTFQEEDKEKDRENVTFSQIIEHFSAFLFLIPSWIRQ